MSEIVLATHGLTRAYGQSRALDNVSITVEKGEIYGLVGRNGAGKTTLMRLVTGQSAPTAGSVELFGQTGRELARARSRTGAMIETPSFAPFLTARENLEYYRIQRGIPGKGAVDEVLEAVDLRDTGKKKFKTFSLGMKQRLGLALALMNHPDFLILDEPINGLDPQGIAEVRETLYHLNRDRNITLILASHILEELAKIATHYGILHDGALLQELTRQELLEKCGERIELQTSDTRRACTVLEGLGITQYKVVDRDTICIYERLHDGGAITMALAQAGVQTTGITVQNEALEDYYLNLTGGGRHA